ncbi:MAG TPA: ferritin family protein [bacterium]|nr:ferritin family protein [bacterium]HQG45566.1 ferritin family protein [bacterium]HQI49686.1 ferritin family protein [bacterium]HQJ65854.1 ferritin family protein [bacterium]
MANLFLAHEIITMNITEEHNGAAFYAALAQSAESPALRNTAAAIAQQEKVHEERFARLAETLEPPAAAESYAGEYEAYIEQLWQHKMFSDEQDAIDTAANFDDLTAVEFAMQTEEATLALLRQLIQHVDPKEQQVVQETITEEEGHIDQLRLVLHQLRT